MKRTKTILAIIAVAIIAGVSIFVACTKENSSLFITKSISDHLTPTPEFPDNLYDTVGAWHNMLLMPSYQNLVNNGQWDASMAITFANQESALHNFDTTYCRSWATSIREDWENIFLLEEMPEAFPTSINNYCSVSDNVAYILDTLIQGVYKMANDDEETDYVPFKKRIMQCEVTVMSTDYITSSEKAILLSSMSVLRYSLFFWRERLDQDYPELQESDRPKKWVKYLCVGLADVAGGVIGGVSSGGLGAVTGAAAASNCALAIAKEIENDSNQGNNNGGTGNGGDGDGNGNGNNGGNDDGGNPNPDGGGQ